MINQNLYKYNTDNAKKVEILAPAGSYDIMKAVIQAGADAVYLGGDFFGARAFAGNFHEGELIDAIEYAHQFNRKIYLTVNTLLKESEINSRLISYLTPYYEAGLDAVIVQDFGVFNLIRKHFPDLHIHASTQMTQTGAAGAEILRAAGATRVVTSRELNCQEIRMIHEACDVEIESFVHGALCYCYSGQCLMSSFNGGRSGNRGRCAQPCRLPYDIDGVDNQGKKYILSPKDMCALPVLPDVIESGVYSLKIEGRMKNVTYAAGVTAIYRKYVDMYLSRGRKGYHVDEQDINDLMDLYNRGAFTEGYYTRDKGEKMLSLGRPNHMGTKALRIVENVNGRVKFKALEPINAHDVFEIDKEHSFSSGDAYKEGESFIVNLPKKYKLNPGMELFRTRNDALTQWVQNCFVGEHLKVTADMSFAAVTDSPMSLTMYHTEGDECISVTVEGPVVTKAQKQPAVESKIKEQLCKLGDTVLKPEHVEIFLSEDAFVPASQLNELRREAAGKLVDALRGRGRRTSVNGLPQDGKCTEETCLEQSGKCTDNLTGMDIIDVDGEYQPEKHVLFEKMEHFATVMEYEDVREVYFDYNLIYDKAEELKAALETLHNMEKTGILALPHILKAKNSALFEELISKADTFEFDGFLVRNLEELGMLGRMGCTRRIYTDAGLYITNTHSKEQLKELALTAGVSLKRMTLPYELTEKELAYVAGSDTELVVYGSIPMMLSEQCVKKTFGRCDRSCGSVRIGNQGGRYIVKSNCRFCYALTSGINKLDLNTAPEIGRTLKTGSVRIEFSDESEEQIRAVLSNQMGRGSKAESEKNSTFGHFYRGVE